MKDRPISKPQADGWLARIWRVGSPVVNEYSFFCTMSRYDSDLWLFACSSLAGALIAGALVLIMCVAAGAAPHAVVLLILGGLLGMIASAIGASGISARRAVLYGIILFSSAAAMAAFGATDSGPTTERICFVMTSGAVGSLCARTGVMVERGFPGSENDPPWFQFSLLELLGLYIPLALLAGYFGRLM